MDPVFIILMIIVVPIIAIIVESPIARALAKRISIPKVNVELQQRIDSLEIEMETIREAQEFTNKLLTKGNSDDTSELL